MSIWNTTLRGAERLAAQAALSCFPRLSIRLKTI